MLEISMKVTGNAQRKMNKVIKDIEKAKKKSLRQVGQAVQKDARQRIAISKTDPAGKAWSPWKFSTMEQRTQDGSASRGLLYRTGALWRSIYYKVENNGVLIGSTKRYAKYIQEDKKRPREILDLNNPRMKKIIRDIFRRNLRKI